MRTARTAKDEFPQEILSVDGPFDLLGLGNVIIEGTQGYGLGLHHRNYPQVTSSDCRAIDFLAMAGISPWSMDVFRFKVIVVARCFPIRVAGNSGPLQGETSWSALGLPEERTTVTNKVRRVGTWDSELLDEAIRANGGGNWNPDVQLAITMLDQRFPDVEGATDKRELSAEAIDWLAEVQDEHETDVALVGTSPKTMMEVAI
jgi:adenylosuccinate synthase